MKKQLFSLVALGALVLGIGSVTADTREAEAQQAGGAAGLVAAVVQVQDLQIIDDIDVAFRDINVVRNVLNNSNLLSNNDIDIEDIRILTIDDALNDNVVTVEVLEGLDVEVEEVVAVIQVLSGGVLVLT